MTTANYIGRYAPSPTGEQHLGNLRTALLAWLHARLHNGTFLVRMEDLDTPRVVSGSAANILKDLELLGIDWDGEVLYQSTRSLAYTQALEELRVKDLVYECFCSRKDIRLAASAPHENGSPSAAYPGSCATLSTDEIKVKSRQKAPAMRLRVSDQQIEFPDDCLGLQSEILSESCGDFVVKRADGLFAYQLAVVVDDLYQGITHVVRGADLASSSARQLYLGQLLKPTRTPIKFAHVPLMLDREEVRMSKRDGSESLREWLGTGKSVEQFVGAIAVDLGLINDSDGISSKDLLQSITREQFMRVLAST